MDKEEEEIILHLLWRSLLKRGGHYFYLESRERGTYSQLLPQWLDEIDLQFYVRLFQKLMPDSAKLLFHQTHTEEREIYPTYIIIGLPDKYTFMAVMKKEKKELQTLYSSVNIFTTPGGRGEC